ncbi:MAG: DUF1553 domain-containing protein [Fimbriimonadaceae bacterium]|nr:DUF1553 domain-containing protein [Chthonomonadaceae bacterium]MCO5297536.1 DUF1553 domain-containing protein [Fimbriimonadaceae bacterium]
MRFSPPLFIASLGLLAIGAASRQVPQQGAPEIVFGRDVMPILGQRCFKCHGPDAAQAAAGLHLDARESALQVIDPGSPDTSLLIQRVSAQDPAMRMPPQNSGVKPLTPEQIGTLRAWIKQGARYEKHWSFVPPAMPSLPKVRMADWPKNLIDRFVLAKLEAAGLAPEPEADRNTLALRAAQTLTGLPPMLSERDAFLKDTKPGAYERYVDRLLAKPSYGEHQARYWLDAVRYGDTHGLQLDNERGVFPYRDWVVRAFNEDLPYDRFVRWQVAGDLLPNPTTEQLIATGYVRMNLTSNEGGAIAEEFLARNTFDRVDTTGTVLLGLTVGCAKCHDHKFDPIKQRDYYGLFAFFNSTEDKPLDGNETLPPPVVRAATPEQEERLAAMSKELAQLRGKVSPATAATALEKSRPPSPTTRDWMISEVFSRGSFDEAFDAVEAAEPGPPGSVPWKPLKLEIGKDLTNLIGKPNASVYVKGTVHLATARTITFGVSSDDAVKVWLNGKLIHSHKIGRGLNMGVDSVKGDFRAGDNELVVKLVNLTAPDGLNLRLVDADDQRVGDAIRAYRQAPGDANAADSLRAVFLELGPASPEALKYRKILKGRAELEASIPMSLIAREMPKPRDTFILLRGQYDQKGAPVTRHIPPAIGELPANAPKNRLGLADWLASPENPLVARVFVNRLWQHHFGTGLVKTAEDFGTQGEWPLNQPLLDYLAVSFQKNGWSIKKLNRLIVTSAAFRQSSRIRPDKLAKDPENRLVSRGPRFRLDAEVIRDKALFAGGLLLERLGGRGFKPYQPEGIWEGASDPASQTHIYVRDQGDSIYRRSLYLFWKRTAPPPAMLNLDAPLRDTCVVRRSTTNTPLQALTIENETAFLEAAREMARRILETPGDDDAHLRRAFERALARAPRAPEVDVLKGALAHYRRKYAADPAAAKKLLSVGDAPQAQKLSPSELAAWMIVCSTLMNTDEFLTQH